MTLQAALDAGLAAVPDCRAVCCVDIVSGIILAKSLRAALPQETLDKLAAFGGRMIVCPDLSPAPNAPGRGAATTAPPALICLMGRSATLVFARAHSGTDHFLCYSCGTKTDRVALSAAVDQNCKSVAEVMQ